MSNMGMLTCTLPSRVFPTHRRYVTIAPAFFSLQVIRKPHRNFFPRHRHMHEHRIDRRRLLHRHPRLVPMVIRVERQVGPDVDGFEVRDTCERAVDRCPCCGVEPFFVVSGVNDAAH